eukprot:TRINITY_DN94910_c0_g1_i1.p1 TRINITY_DN94910_c0_g1~~TRINITY_DN94910_c0_g1_i1.p1  ORF type:complete len:212 (-),score=16.02 TRINITY_DN94910_c0_g1_i1:156-791(-)
MASSDVIVCGVNGDFLLAVVDYSMFVCDVMREVRVSIGGVSACLILDGVRELDPWDSLRDLGVEAGGQLTAVLLEWWHLREQGRCAAGLATMGYTAAELVAARYELSDILSCGYHCRELIQAGYRPHELWYCKFRQSAGRDSLRDELVNEGWVASWRTGPQDPRERRFTEPVRRKLDGKFYDFPERCEQISEMCSMIEDPECLRIWKNCTY